MRDGLKITKCRGKKDKNAIELPRPHSEAGEAVLRVGQVGDGAEGDAFEIRLGEGKKGKKGERGVSGDIWAIRGNRRRPLAHPEANPLTYVLSPLLRHILISHQ